VQLDGQRDTLVNKLSMNLPRHGPLYSASCWPRILKGKRKILRVANIDCIPYQCHLKNAHILRSV
jgi:hypothetical protein